jgi:translocation and assembly module TamB
MTLLRSPVRLLSAALALCLMLAGLVWFSGIARSADEDKGVLADLISRALSSETSQVSVGAVDGALSSDATIRDITISDRDGVWLRLDKARLIWTRTALLMGRLEVNTLEIGKLDILRKPVPAPGPAPKSNEPLLPELPVKVVIEKFALGELSLGESILGVAARLGASGNATLGAPSEGLNLKIDIERLDAPGRIAIAGAYVPQTTAIRTSIRADEPAGGLIARLANIPGLPPVKLEAGGDGTLDKLDATISFDAGDTIGAKGGVHLTRAGAGRQLALDLAARIEGLMPALAAPVFADTTRLDGNLQLGDDGAITLDGLTLTSKLARLNIAGTYGTDAMLDVAITASAVPNEGGGRTKAGESEIGRLALDATIRGPVKGPRVHATLQAADARVPEGALKSLDLTFDATPTALFGDPDAHLKLIADGRIAGLKLTDAGLDRALGDSVTLAVNGDVDANGDGRFETAKIATRWSEVSFAGTVGAEVIDGKAATRHSDLSRFSGLAGRTLSGTAEVSGAIKGNPRLKTFTVDLDGNAKALSTGIAAFDGLTGGSLTLSGTVAQPAEGRYSATGVRLAGAHLAATADGALGQDASDLAVKLDLPALQHADKRLTGKAAVSAHVTGPLAHLNADARIGLSEAKALGRPIPKLDLVATLKDLQGALAAKVTLSGSVDGKAATGTVEAARQPDGGWQATPIDIAVGSVGLKGGVTLLPSGLATGKLALAAGNLDDISALLLTKLSGRLDGNLTLDAPQGGQSVQFDANGQKLAFAGNSIDKLAASVGILDALRRPVINADVTVDRAQVAGEAITGIRLKAAGTAEASDITLAAKAHGFDLDARGRLTPADTIRFELSRFDARRDGRRITLSQPARFALLDGGVSIDGLKLAIERGTVSIDGKAGETLDLNVAVNALPLSAARIVAPQLNLAGTLDANARVKGRAGNLTGPWQVKVANFASPETREAGLPPINLTAKGALEGAQSSLDAVITAGKVADLKLAGRVPLTRTGALDVSARGRLDAALANASLAAGGRRVTGAITLDAKATGSIANPELNGSASFANGTFTDALQGVQLKNMQARIVAHGTDITIESARATARNGGTLSASGRVKVDPQAGFPAALKLQGNKAELVSNGLVTAVVSLALDVSGPLTQRPVVGGRVDLETVEVKIPDRLPASLRPVDGIRHVNPNRVAAARMAEKKKAVQLAARRGKARAFDAGLDVTVSAPSRIFVRGRGIDAELGGRIKVSGTLNDPAVNGAFDLRRGRLQLLSQRLDFTRGRLTFAGALDPQLDFVAQTRAADVTASINVSGSAASPSFAFSSQPDLPQDEILSRILFSKASGSLSAFQAIQLAQSAAQLAGGGDSAFEKLRKSLGVDDLDIQMGADGGPTVGASRYIGNNISVGVKTGAKPEESGVSVRLDVTRHLKLQAEAQANGAAAAGVGAEWEY